jgi:hypothetical protein
MDARTRRTSWSRCESTWPGQERHQRVDDDQHGGLALHQILKQEQVGGQLGRPGRLALGVDVGQDPTAGQVGPGGLQPRTDGVGEVVLGREQNDVAGLRPGPIGERRAGRHLGGDGQGQGALADAGVAIEHHELPARDPARPQPRHLLALDVGDQDQVVAHAADRLGPQ